MKTHRASASNVRLSPLLDRVYVAGDHVEITRRGEVVARLVPAECRWAAVPVEEGGGFDSGCSSSWWEDGDARAMSFCPHCAGKIILPDKEGDDA